MKVIVKKYMLYHVNVMILLVLPDVCTICPVFIIIYLGNRLISGVKHDI